MAGINGKIKTLPPEGFQATPGHVYVDRVRVGYGDSGRTSGGASDGCHRWLDTAGAVALWTIAATSSDYTSDGSGQSHQYGGVVVHGVWSICRTAWAGATAVTIGDCGDADGWAEDSDWGLTTDVMPVIRSSNINSPPYGQFYPKVYCTTDADQIEANFTGDATAGIQDVYVMWSYMDYGTLANTDWPDS